MDKLRIEGNRFVDSVGREVHLRGVNLGGSSKMPPSEPTHLVNNFSRHREVSFIGRPFSLSEARTHFARLHHWGFNLVRFITTWEAIEHAGIGEYDAAYLNYLTEIVALAGEYGLYVFVDPHQDVWSRMTGGDGAPGWTLDAIGFDIQMLDSSEAAITMQRRYPDYPGMIWTDNASRLAAMTMFTLFFSGNIFTPEFEINGVPVQEFLQGAFIGAMQQVAVRLKDMPHVLGYDTLNEPLRGFIGLESLEKTSGFRQQAVRLSGADAILLGAGFPRRVTPLKRKGFDYVPDGEVILNPRGISAWKDLDIWREVGVWDFDESGAPAIICDDFFAGVDFLDDGLLPFIKRYAQAIRAVHPEAILFVESDPSETQRFRLDSSEIDNIVNASHWYDERMLFTKSFDGESAFDLTTHEEARGRAAVVETFAANVGTICRLADAMGGVPTLIGEFGLAYDINNKSAYVTGDFSAHELALSLYYDALDSHLAHSAQWNYTADNTHQWGDNWNLEDLSIFSGDDQINPHDLHSGGRAIRGFARPYIQRTAGRVQRRRFIFPTGHFEGVIYFSEAAESETVIYLPNIWYGSGYRIVVSSGEWYVTADAQFIQWSGQKSGEQTITITPI